MNKSDFLARVSQLYNHYLSIKDSVVMSEVQLQTMKWIYETHSELSAVADRMPAYTSEQTKGMLEEVAHQVLIWRLKGME